MDEAKTDTAEIDDAGTADSSEFFPVADDDLDHELFEKNMATFRKYQPSVAMDLEKITDRHSRLITDGDGGFDIEFRGNRLYGKASSVWAEERMEGLKTQPGLRRLYLSPMDSNSLDDDANITIHRIIKRADEAGMKFARQPIDDHCFHLVIMGIGLGEHVEEMMKLTDCQHVVLVEPNLEFLLWSFYIYDWADLYGRFVTRLRKISFITNQNFEKITENVRDRMRYMNPSFMDSTFFLSTYKSSMMDAALGKLLEQKQLLTTGLGFLEDEIDMVRNSYYNLKDFSGRYYQCFSPKEVRPLPAFIIGAGPSLDSDIDFIRENQDRALIISCGTAIRVLLSRGIKPDFQMEIENVPAVTELSEMVAEKFDLSGITLVATSTVDPGVQKLYDETVFYFRSSLASYPMFFQGPESTIRNSTPNISNLGFSFTQEIGARSIYFFGCDLGARNPKKHHADESAYNAGEVAFNTKIDQPTAANFGGEVYSEMLYMWTKACLEEAINRFPANRTYYNCSDGVRIQGTVPVLSSQIKLPPAADKAGDIEKIKEGFPAYTPRHFRKSWTERDPVQRIKRFRDLVLARCDEPPVDPRLAKKKLNDGYDVKPAIDPDLPDHLAEKLDAEEKDWETEFPFAYMCEVVRDFIPSSNKSTTEMHYYRGSTFMSMAALYFYYQRALNAGENREDFLKIVKEEFIDQTKRIGDVILDFYGTLEPVKKPRKKKKAAPKKATAKKSPKKTAKKSAKKSPATKSTGAPKKTGK